jgi:hypothetical protein
MEFVNLMQSVIILKAHFSKSHTFTSLSMSNLNYYIIRNTDDTVPINISVELL